MVWVAVAGDRIDEVDRRLAAGPATREVITDARPHRRRRQRRHLHRHRAPQAGHEVLIIEVDPDRVSRALAARRGRGRHLAEPRRLRGLAVRQGRAGRADVVVAVTGDDEDNLVISLLAKQEFGVPRVAARVNNPSNEWMFNASWGVDVSVSTPHLLTALVEEAVSVGSLVRLLSFENDRARLSEVTLAENSPAEGIEIQHPGLPRDSTVVAVLRSDHLVVPRGDTVLGAGDEVLVLATVDAEDEVRRLLVGDRVADRPSSSVTASP